MKRILYIVLVALLASCAYKTQELPQPQEFSVFATMPEPRTCVASCVMGEDIYFFGGRDSLSRYCSDLYCYHSTDSTWTKTATPLIPRLNAALVTDGQVLYMGLGYASQYTDQADRYLRDWWSYDPQTMTWTMLDSLCTNETNKPVIGIYHDTIYAFFGTNAGLSGATLQYSINDNQWTSLPTKNLPYPRIAAAGTIIDNTIYLGLGFNTWNRNEWFSYSIPDSVWSQRPSLPGKGRVLSACCHTDEHIYIFGGRYFAGERAGGEVFESYMRFCPASNDWTACGAMPSGVSENQTAFTWHNKPCFGLGENAEGQIDRTIYCIEN